MGRKPNSEEERMISEEERVCPRCGIPLSVITAIRAREVSPRSSRESSGRTDRGLAKTFVWPGLASSYDA